MTGAEVLALAAARGVTIRLDGDGLELIADRKPDSDLLDTIASCKAEIVAFLHPDEAEVLRAPDVADTYGVAYRERIKSLGDDGLKEEPRLRALEAVVALFRANHPFVTIDEAAAAVRAAIQSTSEGQ